MFRTLLAALIVVALAAAAAVAGAPPLADRVPADAVVYVGWAGMSGPAYKQSKLRGLLDELEAEAAVPEALGLMALMNPRLSRAAQLASEVGDLVWARPWAAYVRMPAAAGGEPPRPVVGLWLDAGDAEAATRFEQAVQRQVTELREQVGDAAAATHVRRVGAAVQVQWGEAPAEAAAGGPALGAHEPFRTAAAAADPAVLLYADVAALVARVQAPQGPRQPRAELERVRRFVQRSGLEGVRRLVYAAGFDGPEWAATLWVDAPAPRRGLLQLLDRPALEERTLQLVPGSALWLIAGTFDWSTAFQLVRDAVGDEGGDALAEFDEGVERASLNLGVPVADLLAGLGTQWVVYGDAGLGAPGGMGACLVTPLRDPVVVQRALESVERSVNLMLAQRAAGGGPRFTVQRSQIAGMELRTLALPFVSPTWAVHDGRLYVSAYPQGVTTGHFHAGHPESSLPRQEKFAAVRARLAREGGAVVAVEYADLPRAAPVMNQMVFAWQQLLAQRMGGVAQQDLSALKAMTPYLAPGGRVTWMDDAGYHTHSVFPFPLAHLQSPQGVATDAMPAFVVGATLPALGAARQTAQRMQSNTQARGIHQASVTYAQANNGNMANDIAELLEGNYFTAEYVLAPGSGKEVPADLKQWPKERRMAWVRSNASYLLVPNLKDDIDTEKVAVVGRPEDHDGRGIPVAYNDNHVVWETDVAAVEAKLKQQTGMTIAQLAARQANFGTDAGADAVQAPAAPR